MNKLTKTQKVWIAVVSGVAGLGISYFGIYRPIRKSYLKKADEAAAKAKADQAAASKSPDATQLQNDYQAIKSSPDGFPLQYGSTDAKTGGAVTKLQNYILQHYGSDALGGNAATGKFLSYTEEAVKKYIGWADGQVPKAWYDLFILGKQPGGIW